MSLKLGGRNALAYVGVEPAQPPNLVVLPRPPTHNDSQNFNIGTFWVVPNPPSSPEEVWILVSLSGGVATWVQLYPGTTGGAAEFVEDVGVANAAAGVINIFSGATSIYNNINTFGSGMTVQVRLNDTVQLPNTTAAGATGALFLGGNTFLHNFGTNSTFVGSLAGNVTHSTTSNTGVGHKALNAVTTGEENIAVGDIALQVCTTGSFNSALGSGALGAVTTGSDLIAVGFTAGSNYTTETRNIVIDNAGTIADANTIRIGNAGDYSNCFISGIYTATINTSTAFMVLQDNTEKLGAAQITSTGGTIVITQTPGHINFDVAAAQINSSFLAVVQPNEVLSGPTGTFFVGAAQAMVVVYDDFGVFFPGNGSGTPANFTVPRTGTYQIIWNCLMQATAPITPALTANLVRNGSVYALTSLPIFTGSGSLSTGTVTVTINASLTIGDVLQFSCTIDSTTNPAQFAGNVAASGYKTWVSGMLIK